MCFAPTISGNGAVNVLAGTTTLTANNTYTGPTTVNGGALFVDGSIANSSVTVNSGATLGGASNLAAGLLGTVGETAIMRGGTLAPGNAANPTGTLTIAGNLAFQPRSLGQPDAFYVVQVNPTTASTTVVSGTASLAGTVNAFFVRAQAPTRR